MKNKPKSIDIARVFGRGCAVRRRAQPSGGHEILCRHRAVIFSLDYGDWLGASSHADLTRRQRLVDIPGVSVRLHDEHATIIAFRLAAFDRVADVLRPLTPSRRREAKPRHYRQSFNDRDGSPRQRRAWTGKPRQVPAMASERQVFIDALADGLCRLSLDQINLLRIACQRVDAEQRMEHES